jgi:uncharacterized membrane protein (DUF106 family)
MSFTSFLDPVFNPLLDLHPFISIFIMAFLVTFLVTIVYKYTTDQKRMKQLKTELKEYQDKIRALAKENKPEKAMALQSQAMQKNLEYMKHSFKATLWTMIPVLILFLWMSQNLAYHAIPANQEFTVTAHFAEGHAPNATLSTIPELMLSTPETQEIKYDEKEKDYLAVWRMKGGVGEYKLSIKYNGETYDHVTLISDEKKYSTPEKIIPDSKLKKIVVGNDKVIAFEIFGIKFNWFWTYLILSILLSLLIRKILQVY